MIRRSLIAGLSGGVLISLAGLYPVLSLFAPVALPGWERPVQSEVAHGLLLMASAAVGVPTILSLGAVAARRAGACGRWEGAKAGMIAGLVAGLFCFTTLASPLNALLAYGKLTPHIPNLLNAQLPPVEVLQAYVSVFEGGTFWIENVLFIAVLLGGLQGASVGWRQRATPPSTRSTLYGLLLEGEHPRHWFAGDESAARVGLSVGAIIGVLGLITTFSWFYVGLAPDWPELWEVMRRSQLGMVIAGPVQQALPVLSPLIIAALLGYGVLVVALIKNPPNQLAARISAVILASMVIAGFLFAVIQRLLYFNLGLTPFWLLRVSQNDPQFDPETLASWGSVAVPVALVVMVMASPWIILLLAGLAGVLVGALQGLVGTFFIPLLHPRPVDKAAALQRRLMEKPDEPVPLLYGLFNHYHDAYDVLAHVAVLTYKPLPDVSRLAAAYHTLGTSSAGDASVRSIDGIQAVLTEHPEWRWSTDFGSVYRVLHEVMAARTLEQILLISPLPEQQTSSLPPLIVKSMQHIGRIVSELHKIKKIEDVSTKLIFLENSLQAIHEAQRFVGTQLRSSTQVKTPVPEQVALSSVLDHWQEIVLTTIKRLKGRAYVVSELQNKCCTRTPSMPLMLQVANSGLNVAQQVRLRVLPGADYAPPDEEVQIEILPPGESQQVMVSLTPHEGARRLRVEWEIRYDDAVDADRHIQFADVVEFTEPEKPFQRIFPIPYVTGTPLKTDDVFVGREDVFTFIQENLLGVHQNNVIILHGQRRTGKTSVLYRLGEVMDETHVAVLIDMQGKPARGEADFLFSIADDITFTLEDQGIAVEAPERSDFSEAPEFFFRSRFLRNLYPRLNGKNLLLMFDEFEELQRRVEDKRLQPEIFQFLRNLMQHEERVDFVFSGTHKLEDLGAEYWSTLFNIAAYKPITFLSRAEVSRLILEPVAAYTIEYDPLAIERIIHVTAGHPYFTQLVLHEMIVYHNEVQRNYMTVTDVNEVLERIVERGEAHFKYIWAESSPDERLILQGLAELMVGEKAANVEDLRVFLEKRGHNSANKWTEGLASLESRDILMRQSVKSSLYRFKVDLIRLWIDRTRPAL